MGFFDKIKDAATSAADKAKQMVDNANANREQKKAEQEQHKRDMEAAVKETADAIVAGLLKGYIEGTGYANGLSFGDLLTFTKEFNDKIHLPASSVSTSKVVMHPHIESDLLKKIKEAIPEYTDAEKPLMYLRLNGKEFVYLTDSYLYFHFNLEKDKKYWVNGRIESRNISSFNVEDKDGKYDFCCNGFVLFTFAADKNGKEDYVTLTRYFKSLKEKDYTITDEEVDSLIREKIGAKIEEELNKYLIDNDEKLVYFSWGLDSLSAKDYIFCTTKQIVMVNREMLGATADIKQFYYEDITSASVVQNTNSGDLMVDLIATAITAATKTCDLFLGVAGSNMKASTLYKVEAERIVAVYHQYRKAAKAHAQPQVIVQQQTDPMEQLKKLAELKEMGIITEDEFNVKKKEILGM